MNASDQIIKVLNELSKKIGISIDWTQQNIMPQIQDFMQRYVKFETYTSVMWLILGAMCIIGGTILIVSSIRKKWDELFIILSIILIVSGLIISISNTYDIIKINTIPETYFIDYIKDSILTR